MQIDPEFKKRLKTGVEQYKKIKAGAVSVLDSMHGSGTPTGPARQRVVSPKKKTISRPSTPGAASAGSVASTKKATIVKPSDRSKAFKTPTAYAQNRDLAGQTFSNESPLRRRIKQNMQNMETERWGPIGATTDSGGGGDFGRISGDVRWMDPHAAFARANPFAGLGLSDKRRAELRRESKFDEIMSRYGKDFGGQIAASYFGTTGMAGKELDKIISGLQARAKEGVARTGAEAAKSVAETEAEAYASRPGKPAMRYQAVTDDIGETRAFDKATGEFKGQGMTELPADVKQKWNAMKAEDRERFYNDNPQYRSGIKALYSYGSR